MHYTWAVTPLTHDVNRATADEAEVKNTVVGTANSTELPVKPAEKKPADSTSVSVPHAELAATPSKSSAGG